MLRFFLSCVITLLLFGSVLLNTAKAQSVVESCDSASSKTKPKILGERLLTSIAIRCDTDGHLLAATSGYQWRSLLDTPYFIPARSLLQRGIPNLPADYFSEISARALNSRQRDRFAIDVLQHTFKNVSRPSAVTQVELTTRRGVNLTLYLMPDRGLICQDNCTTLQVFTITSPATEPVMSKGKIGLLIVIGLLNWPVLSLYLGMMLIPSLYPDASHGSKTLDSMMKYNHRGALVIPMVIVMQWKVLIGAYTEQAKRCGYISLLRAGQAMVLTNLVLIISFIAS